MRKSRFYPLVSQQDLPLLFGVTGVFSIGFGPLIGKLSDKIGKYRMFVIGSVFTVGLVIVYNNLGVTPLWAVIALTSPSSPAYPPA